MSIQGQLAGQPWSMWASPPSQPPVRVSPTPASEDVMKLPREDMHTFGRCPAWDPFVLVTCDKCDKIVKIEAFESHMTLRHGSKSEKSAYHRVLAAKAAASLEACEVKLTPSSTATNSSSGSGGGNTPTVGESELPSSTCTSPQPNNMSRSPSPHSDTEQMDTSGPSESGKQKYMGDEADSTTNNVISIPDTDDMANIEIISEGQSLLDSMDSRFSLAQAAANSQSSTSADSTSFSLASTARPKVSVSSAPVSVSRVGAEPMEVETSGSGSGSLATHYITVSPLSKPTVSPNKKLVLGRMVQPHVAHPAPPPSEKKSGRDREYDANKHCGVLDPETKKPCTRSLTCKSHSVYLKRKVLNRSGDFDELLANHKAEKEAAAAKLAAAAAEENSASSILERRLKLSGGGQARLVSQIVLQPGQPAKPLNKESYCEDTLHYTTDHPKPLAVCTFGGKRLGGLFIADRSKLLTRKVMKLALSNSGLRSVPVVRQQTMPYIVNFQGATSSISTISGIPARIGTIKLANSVSNIQTIQPQQIIVQDPFKNEMQDFKGGLKFELSRNIHQIIPSGSESAG